MQFLLRLNHEILRTRVHTLLGKAQASAAVASQIVVYRQNLRDVSVHLFEAFLPCFYSHSRVQSYTIQRITQNPYSTAIGVSCAVGKSLIAIGETIKVMAL